MINNYMLFSNLPTLDLHELDRVNAKIKIEIFIKEQSILKNKLIRVIHGKGSGILKNTLNNILKTNKLVKNYKIDSYNSGITIIELE